MTASTFNMLWKSIDVIESQEHIMTIRALQHTKLKRHARVEREKKLELAAFPRSIYKKDAKDVSFLLSKLGGGNGR